MDLKPLCLSELSPFCIICVECNFMTKKSSKQIWKRKFCQEPRLSCDNVRKQVRQKNG